MGVALQDFSLLAGTIAENVAQTENFDLKLSGAGIEEAGRFAAAMSTLKIEKSGPFNGSKEDVIQCMTTAEQMF